MDYKMYLDLKDNKKKVIFCNSYKIENGFMKFERKTRDKREQITFIPVDQIREIGLLEVSSLVELAKTLDKQSREE